MESKFAVLLPVRNGEDYLAEALESVFVQTRPQWRLIVLDNCSSDRTQTILAEHRHPAMTVLRSEEALSIGDSWARISKAITDFGLLEDYCTILAHDDVLGPTFLECMDALVQARPEATLYQTLFDLIDGQGNLIRPCRPIPASEQAEDFIAARCWGLRDSFGAGYVFRGRDYVSAGGIPAFTRLLYADDLLFARLARPGGKACAQSVECSYRLHRASTSYNVSVDLYRASLEALSKYVGVLESEWHEFTAGPVGTSALAALLAREAMIFTTKPLHKLLPGDLQVEVTQLAALFHAKAGGVPFSRWLGSNFLAREGYIGMKALYLSSLFAMSRLRAA